MQRNVEFWYDKNYEKLFAFVRNILIHTILFVLSLLTLFNPLIFFFLILCLTDLKMVSRLMFSDKKIEVRVSADTLGQCYY